MTARFRGGFATGEARLMLLALAGLVAVTASGQGSYKPFVYLTAVLVLVHGGRVLWQRTPLQPVVIWLLLAPVTFIVCDLLAPGGVGDKRSVQNVLAFAAVALAIWVLPGSLAPLGGRWLHPIIVGGLAAIAAVHAVTVWLYLEPHGFMDNPRLLFHNPHFIALQAAAAGPVMVHAALAPGVVRWMALCGLAAALVTLLLLPSPMGLLAVAAAVAVVVAAAWPPRPLRIASAVAGALVLLAVMVYPAVPGLFQDALAWLEQAASLPRLDERFGIWLEAWHLQRQAEPVQWLLGHGLGGFEAAYPGEWVFPHHFGLEVLYNSGILGLAAFAAAVAALLRVLARGLAADAGFGRARPGGQVLLAAAVLAAVGVFTFLTLPLTARVTAHALGVAVGYALWALKAERLAREASHRPPGSAQAVGA